jgi:glycine oxidase
MSAHPDVLILGGGVIGLSCAYFLARSGVRVEVVDKGDFGQEASWAGAGVLPPTSVDHSETPYDLLRAHGIAMFPALSKELRERTGIDNGFLVSGGLEFVPAKGDDNKEWHGDGTRCECLDDSALHRLEPALSPNVRQAHFLPDMAQLRNPRHVKALLAGCESHQVQLRAGCPIHAFERDGDRITAVRTGIGPVAADRFLIAAGAWSDGLLEQFGFQPGIHPVRGQIALLNTGAPRMRRILCKGKRYMVPRPDGRILVGSTEENAGFDKRPTAGAIADLLSFAASLVPSLAGAHLERCWAGLRPGTPDELPVLGPVPGIANLFVAAGHFRSGIMMSPSTALVMKELLLGEPLTLSLEPFRVDRFAASDSGPAFRS